VFKAASELKAVSMIDSIYAAENAEAADGVVRRSYVDEWAMDGRWRVFAATDIRG
jgi:hypothetical protein